MNFDSFYRQSIDDPNTFWANEARRIDWHQPFTNTLDYSRPPFARWFIDGQTNLCHNAIDRHLPARAEQAALIAISTETGTEKPTRSAHCTPKSIAWQRSCWRKV